MSAVSVQRVRDSPFRESEWDRRLDDMLEDLGTGGGSSQQGSRTVTQTQQFSSSSTQQMNYSSQQGTRTQSASQQSQSVHRSVSGGGQPPQQQHFQQQQQQRSQQGNFALTRGPSGADLAEGTLRDLEDGLEKSTRYIQDSHREGGGGFNLEQQVQHMIPQSMQQRQQTSSSSVQQQQKTQQQTSYSQNVQQQQQQQQYNQVYKVQSNQYSGSGERITGQQQQQAVDEDDRPGSRLKQNIDELDTLLYDLNNARNLSPETAEYGTTDAPSSLGGGLLDSDDYDETVGTTGHVKRTVSAFNEYTTQQGGKPPSPSPRRKPSPTVVRKTPPTSPTRMHQNSANSSAYQQQQQTSYTTYTNTNNSYNNTSYNQINNSQEERAASPYQPLQGPPGSYQPFSYTETTDSSRGGGGAPPRSPSPQPTAVPFPSSSARPPTPQMPPKRVEELMSEFQEFDSTHGGSVSPAPAPFSVRPAAAQPRQHGHVTVTELEDEPPKLQPSPPRKPAASTPGPDVYYPPEFTNTSPPAVVATQEVHPVADGGSLALERKGRREKERRREEGGDKQGAAVIPICLPLCCAAPCVIM